MNCSRFRFLIQQWFDASLPPQDERMLTQHLESCDSCQRFHHQLDQVVQSTPEVPLPDECLPTNIEALARRVLAEIPQEKPGLMSMIKGFLPFLGNGGNRQPKAPKQAKAPKGGAPAPVIEEEQVTSSNFPHVKRKPLQDANPAPRGKKPADEDILATSTRLKNLQRLQPVNEDQQGLSQGASLGTKFGMNVPSRDQQEDTPLTFAESIRRKVKEDTKPAGMEGDDQESTGNPFAAVQQQGYGQSGTGFGGPGPGGFVSPPASGGFGAPGSSPDAGAGGGFGGAPNPGMVGQWGETAPNVAPQPGGAGWNDPPVPGVGGDSDWKPRTAADWQMAKPQTPAWQTGSPTGQGPAPGTGTGDQGMGWGSSWPDDASDEWGSGPHQRKQTQGSAPAPGPNDGWGAPSPGAPASNDSWGQPANNATANAGWGQPPAQPASDGWGQPPAQPASDGWGQPPAQPAGESWGQPPQPAGDGWGQPAQSTNDGWGAPTSPGGGWGNGPSQTAQPSPGTSDGWGGAPGGTPADTGWGVSNAPPLPGMPTSPAPGGWGAGSGAPTPLANDDTWGSAAQTGSTGGWQASGADSGWGTAGGAKQDAGNWNAPASASLGWSSPPGQSGEDAGWDTIAGSKSESAGWGAPAQGGWNSAPLPPDGQGSSWTNQNSDSGWGVQNSQSGQWSNTPANQTPNTSGQYGSPNQPPPVPLGGQPNQPAGSNPYIQSSVPPPAPSTPPGSNIVPPSSDFDSWSEEGEQIQTGMWQAFTLDEPALGAPKVGNSRPSLPKPGGMVPPGSPAQPEDSAARWDMPIQERMKLQNAAAAAETAEAESNPNRWDAPIQDRIKMQGQPPAPMANVPPLPSAQAAGAADDAAGRWDAPIQDRMNAPAQAPAAATASGGGGLQNSIMDRLNSILGEEITAMASTGGGSIPGQPVPPVPTPATVPTPAANAGWNTPQQGGWSQPGGAPVPSVPPVPMPGSQPLPVPGAPVPPVGAPQPASAPSAYDIPIQERMRQQGAAPAPGGTADKGGGLFKNLDDQAIDKVFSQLGVNDSVSAAASAPTSMPPLPAPTAAVPPVPPMAGRQAPPVPPVAPLPGPAVRTPVPGADPPIPGAQPAAAAAASADNGLFKQLDDSAMDRIFSNNLGIKDESGTAAAARPSAVPSPAAPSPAAPSPAVPPAPPVPAVSAPTPVPPPGRPGAAPPVPPRPVPSGQQPSWKQPQPINPTPAPAQPAAAAGSSEKGLFNVDDATMDRIFNDLGVKEKPAPVPKINVREAVQQIRTLSAEIPTPPKVEGIGRLSLTDDAPSATAGKINAIGKFLLDQQDLQRIGRLTQEDLSDTKVRVLTHEASDEINKLLEHIATQAGVIGSVIVGHDGILIANSLPKEMDAESIGILSLAIYVNTSTIIKKQPMKHNHLHQLVSRTQHGYLVVADFGGGILVTVSNSQETEKLIPLMRSITQLVAQT